MRKQVEIGFDQERAVLVFRRIIEAWQNRELKLKGIIPAEIRILSLMDDLSDAHKSWVLYLVGSLSLSHQKTRTLTNKIIEILEKKPWLQNSNFLKPISLAEYIFYEGWALHQHRANLERFWFESKQKFKDNDPRQIFVDYGSDQDKLINELDSIFGIDLKIAHLLNVYFQEWANTSNHQLHQEWNGIDNIKAVPIDSHWYKMLRQTEIVTSWNTEYHKSVIRYCCEFACNLCQNYRLENISLVQGAWHTFSDICSVKPRDPDRRAFHCFNYCPLDSLCNFVVRPTKKEESVGIVGWSSATQRLRFSNNY